MSIREYKGYQIKPHKEFAMNLIIVTAGKGGKVPDVLSGLYTNVNVAKQEIDKYLESKPQKGKQNDETGDKG